MGFWIRTAEEKLERGRKKATAAPCRACQCNPDQEWTAARRTLTDFANNRARTQKTSILITVVALAALLAGCGGATSASKPDDSAARAAYLHVVGVGLSDIGPSMTATGTACDSGAADACTTAIGTTRSKVEDLTGNLDKQSVPAALAKGDTDMKKALRDTTAALDLMQQAIVESNADKETAATAALSAASTEITTAGDELAA